MSDINESELYCVARRFEQTQHPNHQRYGICSNCKFLGHQKTLYGNESAWCTQGWDEMIGPNMVDPITECIEFYPRGHPSLSEMFEMAWIIDRVNNPVGFSNTKEIEIIKRKKKE